MNVTPVRHRLPVAALLTATVLVTGCQGGDGGTGGGAAALSLSGLTRTADEGTDACPLAYDLAKAAKAAGLDGAIGVGPAQDDGDPVATAEGGRRAAPGEPLAENPGALVSCTFHIGENDVRVHTVATREPHAITPLAPVVQVLSASSIEELADYLKKVFDTGPGDAVVTDSGNVAAVRLKLDGDGDACLLVGLGGAGAASPGRRQQVGDLAETLANQV
ncbi:hypothetical protein LUX12_04105 [Streptomyces somaliensis]|uniref:hypothetical protein n=1 Tax=Streptomyces somaliensis TaxID=78355 RepID=UPI0020CE4BC2|nr:hypothetical protein [Streptomyces somaliensis]MCP9944154.1 hypothetical protein [Streptomyces somaliensis]MCP9962611.1 hypothetical protein [Streptomyces somaliensis]MCP9975441.1 hypothetical protein [Streptomyces somaliensis]